MTAARHGRLWVVGLSMAAVAAAIGIAIGWRYGQLSSTPASTPQPIVLGPTSGAAAAEAPTTVDRGAELYVRECAACHGQCGEGEPDWKITRADGSLPAPPHDGSGHTWHHPDAELLRIIAEGGTFYMPESKMPGFGDKLSQAEMAAVLAHIKTFWGTEERAYQAERTDDWQAQYESITPQSLPTVP